MNNKDIRSKDIKIIPIIPVVSYNNALLYKSLIYKDNNNKIGIYRWNNLINGKSYVGSSINLSNRLSIYYSKKAMLNKLNTSTSIIYSALLKHGINSFSVDILEYCEPDVLIKREQYYIDYLVPEYNILKAANSRIGSKHSVKTKTLMSIKLSGANHPFFGKTFTDETRKRISESLKTSIAFKNSIKLRPKIRKSETLLKMSLRTRGVIVRVINLTNNIVKEFPTIKSAALYFNVSSRTISRHLDKNIPYKNYLLISQLVNK